MEDVSAQTSGDFLVNYGGVTDADDPNKMTVYQILVTRLPIGYKDVDEKELTNKIDDLIKSQMSSMKNVTPISFGYEGYKGYIGETSHNGMKQKGVIFSKSPCAKGTGARAYFSSGLDRGFSIMAERTCSLETWV